MVNLVGGDHGEKKVTIVVHSDVKKILNTVKEKFYEYSKSVTNLDVKITTSPIVSLEKAGDDCREWRDYLQSNSSASINQR